MALPKITQPEFEITLPVINKKIKFRPFLVKEEKVLLIGKEGSAGEQMNAMVQILKDVVLSPKNFDPTDLTAVDIEYLFMHLRAKSVNNIVKLKYKDTEDENVYDFELDLNEIEPVFDPDRSNILDVGDYKVELKEPSLKILENLELNFDDAKDIGVDEISPDQVEGVFKLLSHCLVSVSDKDTVYDDFTVQEAKEWFQAIDLRSFENIQTWFETAPKLEHTFNYVNKKGNNRKITLRGIQDFF